MMTDAEPGRGYWTRAFLKASRVDFHYDVKRAEDDIKRINCRVRITGLGAVSFRAIPIRRVDITVPRR